MDGDCQKMIHQEYVSLLKEYKDKPVASRLVMLNLWRAEIMLDLSRR